MPLLDPCSFGLCAPNGGPPGGGGFPPGGSPPPECQPGTGPGWYCVTAQGYLTGCYWSNDGISFLNLPPNSEPNQVLGGPYSDRATCETACAAGGGGPQPCPPPGGQPPPIQPPPTSPPPTSPPPTTPPPGSSCDNPLYITTCPPPQTSPPPGSPPPGQPPPGQPPQQQCPPGQHWDDQQQQCVPDEQPPEQPPPQQPPTGGGGFGGQPCVTDSLIDLTNTVSAWANGLSIPGLGNFSQVIGSIPIVGWILQQIINAGGLDFTNIQNTVGCQLPAAVGLTTARWLIGFLDHWGIRMPEVVRVMDYGINTACPTELPSAGDANECMLSGAIDANTWNYWVTANGYCPTPWSKVLYARREKPDTEQLIQWSRRQGFTDQQTASLLSLYGWLDQGEAQVRVQLYDELPPVSDILHFLTRNVFDTAYVEDYDLMEGFAERFLPVFGDILHSQGITEQVAAWHYAAHWINPAPGELKTFAWRLRPGRDPNGITFTEEDYARLLVEQDVSPYMRERFQATLYNVPALGYVRDMYRSYIISDQELKDIHQDLGYSEENSQRFLQIDQLVRARMRAAETHGWVPSALAKAYISKQLTPQQVTQIMGTLGYTPAESNTLMQRARAELQYTVFTRARSRMMFAALSTVKQGMQAGVLDPVAASQALQQLGWPVEYAQGWAGITADTANIALVKQAQNRIRSEYLSGAITLDQARSALGTLGVVPSFAQNLLSVWQLEFTPKIRRRSAGQIVNDVANDEMSFGEAYVRLTNLGYPDADSRLFLADAERKILAREESAVKAQARGDLQAANQLAKLVRELEKQKAELLRELKKNSPPAKLQKWAKLGIAGRDLFFERMRTFGYDDSDIERWWEEACAAKGAACSETTPPTPSPPAGAGGSGFPG
jgi:hypothetical protein